MANRKKPLNISIGRRIQFSREQAGLTQEQLAERLDLSTQFISTIERGAAGASLDTIVGLCDVLNVSSDWLLRGQRAAPDTRNVVAKLTMLSDEQLAIVDDIISSLLALLGTAPSADWLSEPVPVREPVGQLP